MTPVEKFLTLLQFRLNQAKGKDGIVVISPENSVVEIGPDGSVIEISKIVYTCLGGIVEIRDVVFDHPQQERELLYKAKYLHFVEQDIPNDHKSHSQYLDL